MADLTWRLEPLNFISRWKIGQRGFWDRSSRICNHSLKISIIKMSDPTWQLLILHPDKNVRRSVTGSFSATTEQISFQPLDIIHFSNAHFFRFVLRIMRLLYAQKRALFCCVTSNALTPQTHTYIHHSPALLIIMFRCRSCKTTEPP